MLRADRPQSSHKRIQTVTCRAPGRIVSSLAHAKMVHPGRPRTNPPALCRACDTERTVGRLRSSQDWHLLRLSDVVCKSGFAAFTGDPSLESPSSPPTGRSQSGCFSVHSTGPTRSMSNFYLKNNRQVHRHRQTLENSTKNQIFNPVMKPC